MNFNETIKATYPTWPANVPYISVQGWELEKAIVADRIKGGNNEAFIIAKAHQDNDGRNDWFTYDDKIDFCDKASN